MKAPNPEELIALLDRNPGRSIYLIGLAGCGMSGLAHLLLDLGFAVSGSDLVANQEVRELRARGARIHSGHHARHLNEALPLLVVYSSAVRLENPELQRARELGIPIVRRASLLAGLLQKGRGICVAGMHGKTTTSALLAFALRELGAAPSYAIGALVPQLGRHASLSATPRAPFVVEADESDGSLREFRPQESIILNVDEEHLDYYANLDAICREFEDFAGQTSGLIVFCADDPRLAALFAERPRAISYGFHDLAQYRVERKGILPATLAGDPCTRFEVRHRGERLGEFSTRLRGEKNVSNACAVVAMLHQLGHAPAEIARAMAPFEGAARRQQQLFRDERFSVFDDYAHHPSEIEATIQAIRTYGARRLLVAFQPHRFSRTLHLLDQFARCFGAADQLWITEIYAASEPEIPGINGAMLAAAIRAEGQPAEFVGSLDAMREAVRAAMRPGDVVLFLGAGDITAAAQALAAGLKTEMATPNDDCFKELGASLSRETVLRSDEPLARRTTLRVGGRADLFVEPVSEAELGAVLKFCQKKSLPFMILGRGSNLLIRDGGIRGVVISLGHSAFSVVQVLQDRIHCGAGAKLKAVSVEARRHNLAGLEFLEGIPGSVGGGLRMNAGAMGAWMFEVVDIIRFMDYEGGIHERKASEVNVEYRGCPLFKNHVALGAVLKGEKATKQTISERAKMFNQKRWESQPAAPSAGCIFKNPTTIPAGKLIDELGLKGTRVGGAMVSDIHGNFIINDGTATACDVLSLIEMIKQRARSARGIELHTEVEIIGENS